MIALWPVAAQASTQAGCWSRSTRCTHSVQRLDAALAARHVRLLVGDGLVHEGARLVGAGHHAVAAADAGVAVDQHDAVGALERRAGRAHVDAGRLGAVLAHHRRGIASRRSRMSFSSTLRIHCASVAGSRRGPGRSPCRRRSRNRRSRSRTWLVSISMPQRTLRSTRPSAGGHAPVASSSSVTPGRAARRRADRGTAYAEDLAPGSGSPGLPASAGAFFAHWLLRAASARRSPRAACRPARCRRGTRSSRASPRRRRGSPGRSVPAAQSRGPSSGWRGSRRSSARLCFVVRTPLRTVSSRWCFRNSMWMRRMSFGSSTHLAAASRACVSAPRPPRFSDERAGGRAAQQESATQHGRPRGMSRRMSPAAIIDPYSPEAHLDVAGRADVLADVAADALVVVGVHVAAGRRSRLLHLEHGGLRAVDDAVVALEAQAAAHAALGLGDRLGFRRAAPGAPRSCRAPSPRSA